MVLLIALWGYWPAMVFGLVALAAALWTRAALGSEPATVSARGC